MAPLSHALREYEEGFNGNFDDLGVYCCPPLPPYLERKGQLALEDSGNGHVIRDTSFHLLKLFCERSHPLEPLLNTASSTENVLDYRLRYANMFGKIVLFEPQKR